MLLDKSALIIAVVCGCAAWFACRRQSKRRAFAIASIVAAIAAGLTVSWQRGRQDSEPPTLADFVTQRPGEVSGDGYIGSQACKTCHAEQHQTWYASYHRTMTQVATDQAIVPVIERSKIEVGGLTYTLAKRGGVLWGEFPNRPGMPDEPSHTNRPLVMTTGSHHMQVFWYPTGNSRMLGQFPLIYLIHDKKWVHRNDAFMFPPHFPPGDETGRWNQICLHCHTTHPKSIPTSRGANSVTAEFGIACEACHGPGQGHVAYHRAAHDASRSGPTGEVDPIVNPARLTHERSSHVCARCHSLTEPISEAALLKTLRAGFHFRPGDDLAASRVLVQRDQASRDALSYSDSDRVDSLINNTF